MQVISQRLFKIVYFLFAVNIISISCAGSASALSADQQKLLKSGVYYFDIATVTCDASDSDESSSINLSGKDNGQKIFNYFTAHGYTAEQTAGMMGNMIAESHFDPLIYQGGGDQTPPLSGDAGWGIVQWTPGSKVVNYINAQGGTAPAKTDRQATSDYYLGLEIDFLFKQLEGTSAQNSEKAAGDDLKKTTTAADAAVSFLVNYERAADSSPNGSNAQVRKKNAAGVLKLYGGGASTTIGSDDSSTNGDSSSSDICSESDTTTATADLGSGTGNFNTDTSIHYDGVDQAVARAKAIALKPSGTGTLFNKLCSGSSHCYHQCAHITANVWGYPSSGSSYAVGSSPSDGLWHKLLSTGHAHPGDRKIPIGALVFYSTGSLAGHVATYVGDNLVASNDVGDGKSGVTGGFYIVPASSLEKGPWRLHYLGWADPIFGGSGGKVHFGGS